MDNIYVVNSWELFWGRNVNKKFTESTVSVHSSTHGFHTFSTDHLAKVKNRFLVEALYRNSNSSEDHGLGLNLQ